MGQQRHVLGLQTGKVAGNTLLLDFPFPAFPENMGHWAEILAPAYSCLADGRWKEHLPAGQHHHLDAVLLINLRREQLQVEPLFTRAHAQFAGNRPAWVSWQ